MTVNSEDTPRVQYTANSITTIFPITFVYDDISDVHVYFISNSTGLATAWTKDAAGPTGYTVSAGSIIANTAPSNGYLVAVCTTPVTQLVDVKPNRALTADTLEGVFDKLTLIGRDLKGSVSRSLIYGPTYTGSIPYAEDLADEIQTDSVNAAIAAVGSITAADSVHVANIAALRLIEGSASIPTICLDCHTTQLDGGYGPWYWDADSTATDNNGTVVAVTGVVTGRWIRQTNGFITPEMFGGDIVSAASYCTTNGVPIFGDNTYTITETLDLFCFGDLSQATVNADATLVNPAIRVHATSLAKPINIKLPMVNNSAHVAADGWATYASAVGVSVDNLYNSSVYIPQVKGFGIGAYVGGTTSGCSYNTITIGELRNNKVNLKVGPKSSIGWSNENTYQMGRTRHDTSEANGLVPFAGTRNIQITANGYATVPNNNLFLKACVEGDTTTVSATEFMIDLIDAQTNTFIQTRWETPHPNGPTLRFEATSADMCTGNVFLNNGVYQPKITKVGGVTANTVMGSGRISQSFDSGGDGVGFSNGYTDGVSGPHLQGFKAATTALGKRRTATDWVYRLHATGLNGKQSTDAEARMRISWSTTGIYMGSGTINPVSGFQPYGNYQIDVTDDTRFKVQGTWDGGYLMMGAYAIWVDGSGKLRIKSGAPASDTDGAIIGTQN